MRLCGTVPNVKLFPHTFAWYSIVSQFAWAVNAKKLSEKKKPQKAPSSISTTSSESYKELMNSPVKKPVPVEFTNSQFWKSPDLYDIDDLLNEEDE